MPRLLKYNPLLQNVFAVSAGQFSFLRVSCSIVFYFSSASLIVAYIYLLCRDLCPLWDWITWDTQNLCLTLLLLKYLWQCFQLMGIQLRCSSIDKYNFLWQRLNKHQTVCFMPNKCDFCRNEQHHCPLPLWSGSDNLGAVESRLSREKNKSTHNLCILNAGRIYLWGLQATIYILVYVKDRKHKLVSGVADTAGRQEAAEGAGSGAQGQDEEINNPLIIQNSKWLQAIGKRFSNYLINC